MAAPAAHAPAPVTYAPADDYLFTGPDDTVSSRAPSRPPGRYNGSGSGSTPAAPTSGFSARWTTARSDDYAAAAHAAQSGSAPGAGASTSGAGATRPPGPAAPGSHGSFPHPLDIGMIVNPQLRAMPVQDTSGVPGQMVDPNEPFGPEWLSRERDRLLLFYLQPYVRFLDMVAGHGDGDLSRMLNEEFTKASGISSLISTSTAAYDTLAGSANSAIQRPSALPSTAGAEAASSVVPPASMASANEQNALAHASGEPQKSNPVFAPTSEWEALMLLFNRNTPPKKEEIDLIHRMFSSGVMHSVAHLNSGPQSGWLIVNGRTKAGISAALLQLQMARPDLTEHLTLDNLVSRDPAAAFFAQMVNSFITEARFYSNKGRLPQGTHNKNNVRMVAFGQMVQKMRWNRSTGAFDFGGEVERHVRDYRAEYRRR